jgi:hypothetical protein
MLVPRFVAALIAISLSAPAIGAAAEFEPIKEGDTLTGRLRLVPTRHPNGTKIKAYQIVSRPRAMPKGDDFCDYDKGAATFHLIAMKDIQRKQLDPLLGKTISVKVGSLYCSETAWHIGDVAVSQWELLPK